MAKAKKVVAKLDLGKTIRSIRERIGFSLRDLGQELGVAYPQLSRLENGKASPSVATLNKFYDLWQIDIYAYSLCQQRPVAASKHASLAATHCKLMAAAEQTYLAAVDKHIERLKHERLSATRKT